MKRRWEIMRFLAAEQRQRRRKGMIFVCVMALLSYCAVLCYWTLQPTIPNNPEPSQTLSNHSELSGTIVTHSSNFQIFHTVSADRSRLCRDKKFSNSQIFKSYSVFQTSSATPHVLGSASSAPLTTPQHVQTITNYSEPSGTTLNYPKLSPTASSLAYAPSLARSFAASTEQTAARKAGRRSGFVDDPDPQDPGDPLATDPFADDPAPLNPADPLNTPVGDCPWLLILLFVLYRLGIQNHENNARIRAKSTFVHDFCK